MEADFSGYVTKAGLKCSDGRTIAPNAFQHQDKVKVPLVWQHGHTDPENVLGHVLLENRDDGVYGYAFFNKTAKAEHARELVEHKDINAMSIWANQLVERSKRVLHGAIREVSLVLSGANPGALIENVAVRHSDGSEDLLDEDVIIYSGAELEHSDTTVDEKDDMTTIQHAEDEETVQDIYNSMSDKQKQVLHYMIGEALESAGELSQSDIEFDGENANEVYQSMTEAQQELLHFMVGEAIESATDDTTNNNDQKGDIVAHNIFESDKDAPQAPVLSHAEKAQILADATKTGSLKEAVQAYAEEHLQHGIEDIDILFPEARTIGDTPELFGRRTEWVNDLMNKVRKSPFSRIKTFNADITVPEARAKGYIKGTLKKEEFFKVARRVTVPTTIYKKQKLDRDDIIDITDFDVVTWLKGEMRLMLDEEIARAVLVGDGRAADDEDKIDEEKIRPIATDHELYTSVVNVNIDDASSNMSEVADAIVLNRSKLRGTGLPTMYTTETFIARFLTQRDTLGRRLYQSLDQVATELRVAAVVPVEILEEYGDIVAILVNPVDYVIGADKGGNVSMFDDFDIDYNQYKYLIETRISGALTKLKSAMVIKKVAASAALVTPADPTFDPETGALTIVDTTGVVYRNADTNAVINAAGSPYTVAPGATYNVVAEPAAGYYFADSDVDDWSFTADA